jgi:hypothetical protein
LQDGCKESIKELPYQLQQPRVIVHVSIRSGVLSKHTNRELYSPVDVKSSRIESGRVGWLPLALDATGVARHRAVALVDLLAILTHHRLHNNKVYCRVCTSANLDKSTDIARQPSTSISCSKVVSTSLAIEVHALTFPVKFINSDSQGSVCTHYKVVPT